MAVTNILAIPLITLTVQVRNNEDWIDSLKYVVSDAVDAPQLDLRGIDFELEVRRSAEDHEVILNATIKDGTLAIGLPPDFGFLMITIPYSIMKTKEPGVYVADIRAKADGFVRICAYMNLTILEGITKSP